MEKECGDREKEEAVEDILLNKVVRIKGVKLMWGLFITACAIENSCGSFGSTYLVEQRGLGAEATKDILSAGIIPARLAVL